MPGGAPNVVTKSAAEIRWCHIDMSGAMSSRVDASVSAVSVSLDEYTVAEGSETASADLTLTNLGANASVIQAKGNVIPVGKAIEFKVAGGVSGKTYRIKAECDTNGGETLTGHVHLKVE